MPEALASGLPAERGKIFKIMKIGGDFHALNISSKQRTDYRRSISRVQNPYFVIFSVNRFSPHCQQIVFHIAHHFIICAAKGLVIETSVAKGAPNPALQEFLIPRIRCFLRYI